MIERGRFGRGELRRGGLRPRLHRVANYKSSNRASVASGVSVASIRKAEPDESTPVPLTAPALPEALGKPAGRTIGDIPERERKLHAGTSVRQADGARPAAPRGTFQA